MTWDELLAYCLSKPGAWQDRPWGDGEVADEWLLRYPGDAELMRYIGRSGWNTLLIGGAIADDEIEEAVDASYAAVVSKVPRKDRPA